MKAGPQQARHRLTVVPHGQRAQVLPGVATIINSILSIDNHIVDGQVYRPASDRRVFTAITVTRTLMSATFQAGEETISRKRWLLGI